MNTVASLPNHLSLSFQDRIFNSLKTENVADEEIQISNNRQNCAKLEASTTIPQGYVTVDEFFENQKRLLKKYFVK